MEGHKKLCPFLVGKAIKRRKSEEIKQEKLERKREGKERKKIEGENEEERKVGKSGKVEEGLR